MGCYAGNPREGQIVSAREGVREWVHIRTKLMVGGRMDFGQLELEMSRAKVFKVEEKLGSQRNKIKIVNLRKKWLQHVKWGEFLRTQKNYITH